MTKYKKGKVVKASVTGLANYGIFVSLDDYYSGLIHISEISNKFVKDVNDFVKVGETIYVEVLDVVEDDQQMKLSIKNIEYQIQKRNYTKRKITETASGFQTLAYKLPIWIKEYIKMHEIGNNCIDKQIIK